MFNLPSPEAIDLEVLAAIEAGGDAVPEISGQVGRPEESVHESVLRLAERGMVEMNGGAVALTAIGRRVSAHIAVFPPLAPRAAKPAFDLGDVSRFMEMMWSAVPSQRRASTRRNPRARLLASNADRDTAVQLLSDAFAQGRLSSGELEQRTDQALTARTYGDLDAALEGLGGLPSPPRTHPVRRTVFWVAAVLMTPWLLFGSLLLALGAEREDRLGGVIVLAFLLSGLVALGRWAWRRT